MRNNSVRKRESPNHKQNEYARKPEAGLNGIESGASDKIGVTWAPSPLRFAVPGLAQELGPKAQDE